VRARDLLAKAARRLRAARGVVDWEHAGDGRLPVLDLLQLIATLPRNGLGVTAAVTGRLLPWARAGGDATLRRSCAPFGLDVTPALVERLVIAFWLDQLARQLAKCGDRGGSPRWSMDNVDRVLAALGMTGSSVSCPRASSCAWASSSRRVAHPHGRVEGSTPSPPNRASG
jgi:hypothetical protein